MDKLRRAMLFAPGNHPALLQNAGIYGADTVIFDLEDAVSISEKDSARYLVHDAIKHIAYPCEIAVRINHISTPWGYDDLDCILAAKPDLIRLPKGETAEDIKIVDEMISQAEAKYGFEQGSIKMMAAIENPKGLRNAFEIASASPRMVALAIGGEDFVTSLKGWKTKAGLELFVARTELLFAAREAGIQAIDSVFSDVKDDETFIEETTRIKELGFDGKSVVNPRQIELVYRIFTPTGDEIDQANKVLAAYRAGLDRSSGVISLNGKMIDAPMVIRAERILAYASAVKAGQRGE
ncbi:aldolase/citrate lyase family protein [Ammoniphilus sp. YIM 78166]|uniref:aldolase/citrate lyase family protein n=1 Tax=Ammoniphilus sp. YIM 78166 TaxID=1644106 RepID=UPI0010704BB5|nr:aldolase/citrate lyase family protein [Ammoniphilus sp. YIM 78166]